MAAETRPTVDQLAALAPGVTVTVESAQYLGRPRQAVGTVIRVAGPETIVTVSCG